MPTLTLSTRVVEDLGLTRAEMLRPELNQNAKRLLEALLVSRGFNLRDLIHVSELSGRDGFVLTQ